MGPWGIGIGWGNKCKEGIHLWGIALVAEDIRGTCPIGQNVIDEVFPEGKGGVPCLLFLAGLGQRGT